MKWIWWKLRRLKRHVIFTYKKRTEANWLIKKVWRIYPESILAQPMIECVGIAQITSPDGISKIAKVSLDTPRTHVINWFCEWSWTSTSHESAPCKDSLNTGRGNDRSFRFTDPTKNRPRINNTNFHLVKRIKFEDFYISFTIISWKKYLLAILAGPSFGWAEAKFSATSFSASRRVRAAIAANFFERCTAFSAFITKKNRGIAMVFYISIFLDNNYIQLSNWLISEYQICFRKEKFSDKSRISIGKFKEIWNFFQDCRSWAKKKLIWIEMWQNEKP